MIKRSKASERMRKLHSAGGGFGKGFFGIDRRSSSGEIFGLNSRGGFYIAWKWCLVLRIVGNASDILT